MAKGRKPTEIEELVTEAGPRTRIKRPTLQQFPLAAERGYIVALQRIVVAIREDIDKRLVPKLKGLVAAAGERSDSLHTDVKDVEATINGLSDELKLRIDSTHLRAIDATIIKYRNQTSDFGRKQIAGQLRKMLGIDVFPKDPGIQAILDRYLKRNVGLIKKFTGNYVDEVIENVHAGVREGVRPEVIAESFEGRFTKAFNHAKLVARDQIGKLNGNLTELRQTSLGIEEYTWRTSRDERVRPTHLEKEGKRFRWDEPPPDTGHPGNDILCRCSAEPWFPGVPASKENRKTVISRVKKKQAAFKAELKAQKAAKVAKKKAKVAKVKPVSKDKVAAAKAAAAKKAADEKAAAEAKAKLEKAAKQLEEAKAKKAAEVKAAKPKAPKRTLAEIHAERAALEAKTAEAKARAAEAKAKRTAIEADIEAAKQAREQAEFHKLDLSKKQVEAKIAAQAKLNPERVEGKSLFRRSNHEERPQDPVDGRQFDMLRQWTKATNMWEGGAIKRAAIEEFGLKGIPFTSRLNKYTAAQMSGTRQMVRGIYKKTQAELKRQGVKTIRLYRGIGEKYTSVGATESWTTSKKIAKDFAGPNGTVLVEDVPASRILSGHKMPLWRNGPHGQEFEWIVMT
jgi:SPP1 gp7 family putative phage head morphogenesis protein